jgi:membrane fusion protein (multidrug efflux system)
VRFELDARVEAGDVLVELDDRPLLSKLEERRVRLTGVRAQLEPLKKELTAREAALQDTLKAGQMRIDESKARVREAETIAELRTLEAGRGSRLKEGGYLSDSEAARAIAEAEAARAAVDAQSRAQARAEAEQRSLAGELAGELARLERQKTALEAEALALEAEITTLTVDIEQRKIRTPIAGRIGEVFVLRAGAFVEEGDVVATVVPAGDLRAVAEFPLSSVGRLAPGQPARLRLDAFPWTEFGTVRATVNAIATEANDGRVRVELAIDRDPRSAIPLQHGLAGTAIVEVEGVTPWTLVLRAAGHHLRANAGETR